MQLVCYADIDLYRGSINLYPLLISVIARLYLKPKISLLIDTLLNSYNNLVSPSPRLECNKTTNMQGSDSTDTLAGFLINFKMLPKFSNLISNYPSTTLFQTLHTRYMTRFLGLRGSRLNHVALIGVVMPAIMSMGYNQGLLGGVLTLPWFEAQFPEIDVRNAQPSEKHYRSTLQGTVVALYAVGGFLGAIACIALGDLLGRRRALILASVMEMIGAFLMASSFSFSQLVVSRVILGLGTGAQLATAPMWQSEISPATKRGAHVANVGIFAAMGLTLGLLVDLGMSYVSNSASWRVPVGLPIIFGIIVIVFTCQMPESPRWLVRQGRVSAAREVLAALRDTEIDSEVVNKEILDVECSLAIAGKGTLGQIFQMGHQRIFHRASLATGGLMLLQLTGVNSITFYSTYTD
jgi:Arabinose efflux permease